MESFVVLVQFQPFQFYSLLWNSGEKTSTRFRRRTSHRKISTHDEPYCKGAVERIILDFSKPGEEKSWKSVSLEYNCWEWGKTGETRCRQRSKDCIRLLLSWTIYGKFFLSKFFKVGWWQCLDFSRIENWYWDVRTIGDEETQHDGTAQSVVSEVILRERSVRPDVDSQREARPQQFVIGNDEAELELSAESRSFVNRVNDQVRKRQKRMSNVTEDGEKHSMIWGMFMTLTMESAVFTGKNCLNNCQSIANTTDLTLKQMFDISTRLVSEQEISGLETIGWENHSWKDLSLIVLSIFNARRSTSFRILYCVLVRFSRTPNRTMHGKKDWSGSNHLKITEILTESTVNQWNSSGIFSQDSTRCSSVKKSNVYCWTSMRHNIQSSTKLGKTG